MCRGIEPARAGASERVGRQQRAGGAAAGAIFSIRVTGESPHAGGAGERFTEGEQELAVAAAAPGATARDGDRRLAAGEDDLGPAKRALRVPDHVGAHDAAFAFEVITEDF